jgi:hypothetical protein
MNFFRTSYRFLFLISAAVLLLFAVLPAQGTISIESKVDRSTIFIGDVIKYSLIINHDASAQIQTPTLAANLGMFEIRDYQILPPVNDKGLVKEQIDYLISTFDTGEYEIPQLEVQYKVGTDSAMRSIKTEAIKITVQSLNPDQAGDIRDIKPPLVPPRDYRRYMTIGLILLAVGAVIAFLIYCIRRRKRGESLIPKRHKPPRPAHEVALEALDKLVAGDLLAQGQIKSYYSELSDIVRRYIEDRYFIYAPEMTTRQLLAAMRSERLEEENIQMISDFLQPCDLVKFAKYSPDSTEIQQTTQLAFDFIHRTKFVIQETPEQPMPNGAPEPAPVPQQIGEVQ